MTLQELMAQLQADATMHTEARIVVFHDGWWEVFDIVAAGLDVETNVMNIVTCSPSKRLWPGRDV